MCKRMVTAAIAAALTLIVPDLSSAQPSAVPNLTVSGGRDLFVLGVARIGILPLRSRVAPFVTLGGGAMIHSDTFDGGQSYSSTGGAFIAGGGVRINASPRVYIAPELTVGFEPHIRASVTVGIRLH